MNIILLALFVVATISLNQPTNDLTATFSNSYTHTYIENLPQQISTLENLQRNKNAIETKHEADYEVYKNGKPEAVEITSNNYPKPYPASSHAVWILTSENATGFELVIGFFDIAPSTDFLKIHLDNTEADENDSGIILTGKLKGPLKIRSPNSPRLRIEFSSASVVGHTHRGFSLTYVPYGETQKQVPIPPEEVTIAPTPPGSYAVLLTVHERYQNNETWSFFRNILCEATNNYTAKHNLSLESCQSQNVVFVSITKCSNLWPNNMNCIEITFRIILAEKENENVVTTVDPLNGPELTFSNELTTENLEAMWMEYGEATFKMNNFPLYNPPQTNGLILFWTGMALAALVVFIMFLIIISRLRLLSSYINWPASDEDNQNILKKSQDIDITMFPSPHQIVPTLFPTSTNPYSPGSSFLYGGDVYENRPRDAIECFNETDPRLLSGLRRNSSFEIDTPTLTMEINDNERLQQLEQHGKGANQDYSVS